MNVMTVARSIGLVTVDGREVSGTIDEAVVLASISELAATHAGGEDLFADASARVRRARSAGVVQPDATTIVYRSREGAAVQMRYRSEMAEVFTDLAIDVGLREAESLAESRA